MPEICSESPFKIIARSVGRWLPARTQYGAISTSTQLSNNNNRILFQLAGNSDKKVRDIFTNLIAKFASINSNAGKGVPNKELFQEYDKDANNFIQIDHEVAVKKDFR